MVMVADASPLYTISTRAGIFKEAAIKRRQNWYAGGSRKQGISLLRFSGDGIIIIENHYEIMLATLMLEDTVSTMQRENCLMLGRH